MGSDKITEIFYDIQKIYNKIKKKETLEQLENIGIQGWIKMFIRADYESGRIQITKPTDIVWIPQSGVLKIISLTFFLIEIVSILRKLGNGVNGSFFADNSAINITRKN